MHTQSIDNCMCHSIRSMFSVLGIYNFGQKVKKLGVSVAIGGYNQPSLVGIGLTDLPNIGGANGPPVPASL